MEIGIALIVASHSDTVFASGFPADGVRRRDSAVPFERRQAAAPFSRHVNPLFRPSQPLIRVSSKLARLQCWTLSKAKRRPSLPLTDYLGSLAALFGSASRNESRHGGWRANILSSIAVS